MDELDFIIDTNASEDIGTSKKLAIFSASKYTLGEADEAKEHQGNITDDDEEYYGELVFFL